MHAAQFLPDSTRIHSKGVARTIACIFALAVLAVGGPVAPAMAQSAPGIAIDPTVPDELNPSGGGAPQATLAQAAAFAWQEFIALSWPAGPQEGKPGQREAASTTVKFGDPGYDGPLVWETYRHKVETFPGYDGFDLPPPPPGYVADATASYGYDALPEYRYSFDVQACDSQQDTSMQPPWINLDETDQITLASMFAGVVQAQPSEANSAPHIIRYLAKSNRTHFEYIVGNSSTTEDGQQWWNAIPAKVVADTKDYLATNMASPPAGSKDMVSLLDGTIEVKAAWRVLNPDEESSGRFHMQTVRYYEESENSDGICYRDGKWGLIALHIIQKTPTAPYFVYATFEQADNLLTASGSPVEDEDGKIVADVDNLTALEPQVCLNDLRPAETSQGGPEMPSGAGMAVLTKNFETAAGDPLTCLDQAATVTYCEDPGPRLYYINSADFAPPDNAPSDGKICVNKRENPIPDDVIAANTEAHAAMSAYFSENGIADSPWLAYKLINVQHVPYDKVITTQTKNGSLYTGSDPLPSTYYMANIVVETNRSLQLFSTGLSASGGIATDWNTDGSNHKNSYYGGHFYGMGGCMGCHGSQGQTPPGEAGDFSVITARGAVARPEAPAPQTSEGMALIERNRSLN